MSEQRPEYTTPSQEEQEQGGIEMTTLYPKTEPEDIADDNVLGYVNPPWWAVKQGISGSPHFVYKSEEAANEVCEVLNRRHLEETITWLGEFRVEKCKPLKVVKERKEATPHD